MTWITLLWKEKHSWYCNYVSVITIDQLVKQKIQTNSYILNILFKYIVTVMAMVILYKLFKNYRVIWTSWKWQDGSSCNTEIGKKMTTYQEIIFKNLKILFKLKNVLLKCLKLRRTFWVERHLDVVLELLQVVGSKCLFIIL